MEQFADICGTNTVQIRNIWIIWEQISDLQIDIVVVLKKANGVGYRWGKILRIATLSWNRLVAKLQQYLLSPSTEKLHDEAVWENASLAPLDCSASLAMTVKLG